jgi:hypothetical protein
MPALETREWPVEVPSNIAAYSPYTAAIAGDLPLVPEWQRTRLKEETACRFLGR